MHAVQKLYLYRKTLSTKEFKGRGWKVKRCENCRLSLDYCSCQLVKQSDSQCAFFLLMYDNEVLKPSNTGRLIAEVVPDTHASIWRRTEGCSDLDTLLETGKYQPFLIFPKDYAAPEQTIYECNPMLSDEQLESLDAKAIDAKAIENVDYSKINDGKIPLFILLDATWRQAKKIFRKSPYLAALPMVSIPPNLFNEPRPTFDVDGVKTDSASDNFDSRYHIRKADKEGELATAEVAAKVLKLFGQNKAALHLNLWFDVFSYRYQQGVYQVNKGNPNSVKNYLDFLKKHN